MSFEQIKLGQTELKAARLGIGNGYRIDSKAIAWAVENGLNYIFWGSIKFHQVPKALKLLGQNSNKAIIAVPCYGHKYIPLKQWVSFTVNRSLKVLKRDYLDIFQLAYITKKPSNSIMELLKRFKKEGKIKHLGITTHDRKLAKELFDDPNLEIFNIRYNAANRGAEKEIFPFFNKEKALVNFTSTRWGQLLKPIGGWPEDKPIPKAVDCYRFVLTRPEISVCLTGASNIDQLKENVKVLGLGPMSEDELAWIKKFGDLVYRNKRAFMDSKKVSPANP